MATSGERVYQTFRNLWDGFWVIWLAQVLWLLLCLPVVTIPLAFLGLYTCADAVAFGESTSWKTFFSKFKEKWKPALVWSLINLVVMGIFAFYIWFFTQNSVGLSGTAASVLQVTAISILVFWFLLNQFTFPFLLAQEKPSYKQALRNSLVLFIKWPGMTFAFTVLILCVFALALAFRFFWVIFAASLPAFLASSCVKFVTEEIKPKAAEDQLNS
ncbi:MAG: DUF624 domain-containing protein [Anaerolineaceae bacterium]|nr:DUF624 domain-containing protein [Anaerolineaceae bacterium]